MENDGLLKHYAQELKLEILDKNTITDEMLHEVVLQYMDDIYEYNDEDIDDDIMILLVYSILTKILPGAEISLSYNKIYNDCVYMNLKTIQSWCLFVDTHIQIFLMHV